MTALAARAALPVDPFAPIVPLFLSVPDSDLQEFLMEAHALLASCPSIVAAVEEDLDRHGLRKKALRVEDARWFENKTAQLAGLPPSTPPASRPAKPLPCLQQGRPRTPAYVVSIVLMLRGYFGVGFKSCEADSMLQESITLHLFFANLGLDLPGRSTLTELANAVSNPTRRLVLDAQVARALQLDLDNFAMFIQDSTHVAGNTEWPTDSRLMVALVSRLLRIGRKLPRLGLPLLTSTEAERCLEELVTLNRRIEFTAGKKDSKRLRKRSYQKLLKKAKRAHKLLTDLVAPLTAHVVALDVRPSRKLRAAHAVECLRTDLVLLTKAMEACAARVLREDKVPVQDKVLSVSDPDAGFICKGQRDPVIGYKPQLALSEHGIITGFMLPQGNAPDSAQLIPMIKAVTARTKVVPLIVSVDDGYASALNKWKARQFGVWIVSISGAKGHALTSEKVWNSPIYSGARDLRSAAESLMFTVKQGYHFGEVARRGLGAATGEMLEKVLAYNVCKMVCLRRAKAHEREVAARKAANATAPKLLQDDPQQAAA